MLYDFQELLDRRRHELQVVQRRQLHLVPPDLPMYKAAAILASQKIGCWPVVEEKGALLGMLGSNEVLIQTT